MKKKFTFLQGLGVTNFSEKRQGYFFISALKLLKIDNYVAIQIKESEQSCYDLSWIQQKTVVVLPKNTFYINIGKRFIDILISLAVIIFILSWLMPIIGSYILFESPGPFIFIQKRSGIKGKQFYCLKLRTMMQTPSSEFQQTIQNDYRVTKSGKFLRRTNLDEMPQFINVLLGDMSIVGPRPHAIAHDAQYWSSPHYRERYWIRPGITGLAQARGARGATNHIQRMEQRVRYDHFYISHQTFLLDMKIYIWTLKKMLIGDEYAW